MKEKFGLYIANLYKDIPVSVYEGLLIIFCVGTVGIIAFCGWKRGWRKVIGLLLAEYVVLIYCSTVFCRKVSEGVVGHNFSPFWSYEAIKNGKEDLIAENVMNVVVFVPVGIILGSLLKVKGSWLIALMVGMGISGSIEAMQYFLKRGFSEVDDVIHNTIGCILGYILVLLVAKLCKSGRAERMVHG